MIVYNNLFVVCGESVTQTVITTFTLTILCKGGLTSFNLAARFFQPTTTLLKHLNLDMLNNFKDYSCIHISYHMLYFGEQKKTRFTSCHSYTVNIIPADALVT